MKQQGGVGIGKSLLANKGSFMVAASGYLEAVYAAAGSSLLKSDETITSLVPQGPGAYRTYMERGEAAFRTGDFAKAFDEFRLANSISWHNPESLLSLLHARLALDRYSYARAAFYFREALRYLPELPLVPLQPKGFYGNRARYVDHLMRLEAYVRKHPNDSDAAMVLTYLHWFDNRTDSARQALAGALASANNPDQIEAIETFWDGMVASGKVSGKLLPEARPATAPSVSE
ncbi:MAG: hypothetical protein SVT52_08060 [Planctomycetota bacterium]|nr:hypothetical protein [Planctomycetota bacterium]